MKVAINCVSAPKKEPCRQRVRSAFLYIVCMVAILPVCTASLMMSLQLS